MLSANSPHVTRGCLTPVVLILCFVAIATTCATLGGCSSISSPRDGYATVNDAFIGTVQVLLVARDNGQFTDEEWHTEVLPLINIGDALLDQYDEITRTGHDAEPVLLQIRQILASLRPFVQRLER